MPAPVLVTSTEASGGLNGLPCTAENGTAFEESDKEGVGVITCVPPPPPQAPHMDAIEETAAVKKTIVARLEKAPERNGPKIRFMVFSAHRLMRNGTAECVRYYDREIARA